VLLEHLPDLRERDVAVARELLPGPYTLVLANPARRFPLLAGRRVDTIGVRVPDVEGLAAAVLREVGAVAATSANLHGGRDPRRVDDIPREIREAAAVLDGGELPGAPSTVLDFTGPEPIVLREGLASGAEAIARLRDLFAQ
jgi:L-threonylcarbamoyladenylate synthase